MTDVYERSIDRIGLLSIGQISVVLRAYILVRQMPERLRLLAREHGTEEERDRGFAHIGSEYFEAVWHMHENSLNDIDVAISALL